MAEADLFDVFGTTAKASSRSKKRKKQSGEVDSLSDLPPLTPEQESSLLSDALGGAVSGLQFLGETLDKPRRALYGALAGKREALAILPFSDTLGLTDPNETITGRDALESIGILGKNTEGLDAGDVGGFLFEMATDPLSMVGLGVLGKGAKGASAGAKAASRAALDAASPLAKNAALKVGDASLFRLHTPSMGIPFTKYQLPEKELFSWTGDSAAKVHDAISYGKYSPVPQIRKVFSKRELVANLPAENQKLGDFIQDQVQDPGVQSFDDLQKLAELNSRAVKSHSKLRTNAVFQDDASLLEAKVKAVGQYAAQSPKFKSVVDKRLEPFNLSDDAASLQPSFVAQKANKVLADLYDETMDVTKDHGKFGMDLEKHLNDIRESAAEAMEAANITDRHWFEDTIGDLLETKGGNGLSTSDYASVLKNAGYSNDLKAFDEATQAMDDLVGHIRQKLPNLHKKMKEVGVDVGTFTDPFLSHAPRSATAKYAKQGYDLTGARSNILGRMPRTAVNRIARLLGGLNKDKKLADEVAQGLDLNDAAGVKTIFEPAKNATTRPLWDAAQAEGVDFADALSYVKQARNVERETQQAMRDIYIGAAESILGPNWNLAIQQARKSAGNNFDATKIPQFDEIVQRVSYSKGLDGATDYDLANDVFEKLTHPQPVSRFAPRKLSDKKLIQEAVEFAAKSKEERAAQMVDAGVDSFDFGANVATPISKPKKYSDALGAQVLIKEGVKRYEDLTKNMREAIANHPDAEFASLAKNAALDDEAFKNALFATAKGKGYMDVAQDADELLDLMHNHDQFVKGAGGYTRQEITDLVKWFGNLPLEVRKTGFFDRDAVTDVMDYVQQANQKIAQATMIRSVFKNPELVKKLGEGGEISIYDTWKAAGMTDDGLVTLMAEMKGPGYVNELSNLRNALDAATDAQRPELLKQLNAMSGELMGFARENGLSSSIAKAVTRTGKVFTGNNESSWLGKLADRLRSITQGGLYVPWPASHIRNRIGGAAINVIADIVSPTAASDAHKLWTGKNLSDPFIKQIVYDALATKLLDSSHPSGFSGTEALEYLKLAIDRPGQFVGGQPVYQGLLDPMRKYGRQVAETYKDSGFKKAAKQAMFGGEMKSGEQATGMFNFWEVRGGISPGDAKAQQGAVNARGKPLDAMDRLKAKETRVLPMQVGEQLGAYIEFQNRMEAFIHLRRQGWDAHTAALKVKEIHFDYSDLNDFEKKVLRRNVLFYDFMRKNLALQANLLFKQPGGKTAQIVRAENRLQEEAKGKDGFIPSHLREGLSIRLPGEVAGAPPGTARYFSQTGLLPIDEAVSRFQFDRSGFPLAIRRTAEKFASQLAPWYSAPIEQFAGKQLSTGRPLKDLYQYPTGDQDVDFWLQKMPTSRLVSTIRSLSDERKGLAQKAFNLTVGGARFTDVNLPVTRMLEGRRAIQENLAGDKDIGTFESLYAKDFTGLVERAKGGDKNALMQLQLYQQLRQGVRELRKQQAGKDAKKK